jgi:hypothetical protein
MATDYPDWAQHQASAAKLSVELLQCEHVRKMAGLEPCVKKPF